MGHPFLFAGEWRCITDFLIFQETSLCLSPLTERAVFFLSRNQERRNTSSTQKGPSGDYHKYCWYFLAYMQHKVISCPSDGLGQVLWVDGSPPHSDSWTSSFHLMAPPPPPRTVSSHTYIHHIHHITYITYWAHLHPRSHGPHVAHSTFTLP